MPDFRLVADFKPTGDQPAAIERLSEGLARGLRHQTLLGATGTCKTFVLAGVIEKLVSGQVIRPDEGWIRGYLGLPTARIIRTVGRLR